MPGPAPVLSGWHPVNVAPHPYTESGWLVGRRAYGRMAAGSRPSRRRRREAKRHIETHCGHPDSVQKVRADPDGQCGAQRLTGGPWSSRFVSSRQNAVGYRQERLLWPLPAGAGPLLPRRRPSRSRRHMHQHPASERPCSLGAAPRLCPIPRRTVYPSWSSTTLPRCMVRPRATTLERQGSPAPTGARSSRRDATSWRAHSGTCPNPSPGSVFPGCPR